MYRSSSLFFRGSRPLRPYCPAYLSPALPFQWQFHPVLFWPNFCHVFSFPVFLNLGRPCCLFPCGALLRTDFNSEPSLRHTCPAQMSRFLVMSSKILRLWYISFSSLFFSFLVLHSPVLLSLHGPYIFLSTLISITISEFSSIFRNVHVFDP